MELQAVKKRKSAKKEKKSSKGKASKGVYRDFNIKLQNGQSSKKRGTDTVNGIEEPSAKKQRKSAKNPVLVKDQATQPYELPVA